MTVPRGRLQWPAVPSAPPDQTPRRQAALSPAIALRASAIGDEKSESTSECAAHGLSPSGAEERRRYDSHSVSPSVHPPDVVLREVAVLPLGEAERGGGARRAQHGGILVPLGDRVRVRLAPSCAGEVGGSHQARGKPELPEHLTDGTARQVPTTPGVRRRHALPAAASRVGEAGGQEDGQDRGREGRPGTCGQGQGSGWWRVGG